MAEQSGFFNANLVNGEFDRVYLAEHFAKYFSSFIGNGVFGGKSNELMVTQATNSGMKVEVLSGMGWINGFWYENDSNLSLDISVADGVLNRVDNIVLRFGRLEREVKLEVVRGTPASNAVAPALRRDNDYYDLKLAEVSITAGKINITQADITDTRLNSEVCGFVVGVVKQFDTQEFGRQIDGYIANFTEEYNNYIADFVATYKAYLSEYKNFLEGLELNSVDELQSLFTKLNELAEDESALASLGIDVYTNKSEVALLKQTVGYTKKNLIPYPFINSVGNVAEFEGVTWTDLGDGTIKGNGTASANSYFTLYEGGIFLKPGKYILTSGFEDSASAYVFFVKIHKTTGEYANRTTSYNKIAINITESDIENYNILISAYLTGGASLSNVIMSPMLRNADILDPTWEPYVLSAGESLNIANVPGIEYRLAEKWNGKPIYQKTFYVASLGANAVMSIGTGTEWDKVVSVSGYALDKDDLTYYPFPVIPHNQVTPVAVISRVESDGYIVIATSADVSYLEGYITVKYTK